MKVFDISSWQENVDWDAVVAEGIEGVILKIGERSTLDEMFIDHVNAAVAHGMKYGIYYYAHACTHDEAVREAEQVNEWLQEYLAGVTPELGIWYDAESDRMTSGDVTDTCAAFLNRMTDFGYTYIGIYASWNWLSAEGAHLIDIDSLPSYVPYWVAQYNSHNDLADKYPNAAIRIWQYSDHYSDQFPYDADIYN